MNDSAVQRKSSQVSSPGKTSRKRCAFCTCYGVGAGDVVVVVVVEDSLLGEEPVLTVVLVAVFSVVAGEADGFTTVVLFSVLLSAGGLVVSVFCSHAASKAAPARMEMHFFMFSWMEAPMWVNPIIGASILFGLTLTRASFRAQARDHD